MATMNYKEFSPGNILKEYIQCYFICETTTAVLSEDKIFATGAVEIMFNLGSSRMQTMVDDVLADEPYIQLWGQTVAPITRVSFGQHAMFGIRFFAHAASCFLPDSIDQFNNRLLDLRAVAGNRFDSLHAQLFEAATVKERISLTETFLLQQLLVFEKRRAKAKLVHHIMRELQQDDFFDNLANVASRYGLSGRYLQKLFIQYSGLTPNLFSKINRFQKSLYLVAKKDQPLTSIAHQCGYFDQSHFIKDFRSFTGTTASRFKAETSSELLALLNS